MSTINEAFFSHAKLVGLQVIRIDTSPGTLDRSIWSLVGRWPKIVRAMWRLLSYCLVTKNGSVYVSLNGGYGLIYDAIYALIVRTTGARRLILHHHSYRYINKRFWAMRFVSICAGSQAWHIVLCDDMGKRLQAQYRDIQHTRTISNAGWVADIFPATAVTSKRLRTVGFISNLSAAKGLDEVVRLAEKFAANDSELFFLIAGPFESKDDESCYLRRIATLTNVRYLGAVYGHSKGQFFQEIDVLLFPTHYRHEAEPLVILESLSYGRPVIAFDRGCIPCLIDETNGNVVPSDASFELLAADQLEAWRQQEPLHAQLSLGSRRRFEDLVCDSKRARDELFAALAYRS